MDPFKTFDIKLFPKPLKSLTSGVCALQLSVSGVPVLSPDDALDVTPDPHIADLPNVIWNFH